MLQCRGRALFLADVCNSIAPILSVSDYCRRASGCQCFFSTDCSSSFPVILIFRYNVFTCAIALKTLCNWLHVRLKMNGRSSVSGHISIALSQVVSRWDCSCDREKQCWEYFSVCYVCPSLCLSMCLSVCPPLSNHFLISLLLIFLDVYMCLFSHFHFFFANFVQMYFGLIVTNVPVCLYFFISVFPSCSPLYLISNFFEIPLGFFVTFKSVRVFLRFYENSHTIIVSLRAQKLWNQTTRENLLHWWYKH
jgi:hypothetical protein